MSNIQQSYGGCTPEQYAQVTGVLNGDTGAALVLCKVFTTQDRTDEVAYGLDTVFLLFSGALVFIMHGGFAMLEAGAIRSKNAMNILLQTVLDGAASAIMWYLVGFGFAYGIGANPNGFIGDALFGLARYTSHETNWTNWFFQWTFCATAATIPAGAVAERFNFNAYLGYSLFLGGFVYPVVVHWVWCPTGWLGYGCEGPLLGTGMIDFAGSGVVHMTGGLAGLIGAWMVGPRLGRFDMNGNPVPMPGHSAILVVLGTVLLWFGWYGFNPGSALIASNSASAVLAGRAAITTTLSGAAGGLTCLALGFIRNVAWDLISMCNGMLVGFVSVTAGCHVIEPWAAIICGFFAGLIFEGMVAVLLRLRIDDVVSAGPMHGFCGAWGVLFAGLLAKKEYVEQAYSRADYPYGLFYGGGGKLLACQVIGVLAIAGWVAGTMGPFFLLFKLAGALRISAQDEHTGLDVSKHGGSAYNAPGNNFGGAAMGPMEALQLQLTSASGCAQNTNPGHTAQLIVHPQTSTAAKSVGDAIMRGNTMGFYHVYGHTGSNPSGHVGSQHSVASGTGLYGPGIGAGMLGGTSGLMLLTPPLSPGGPEKISSAAKTAPAANGDKTARDLGDLGLSNSVAGMAGHGGDGGDGGGPSGSGSSNPTENGQSLQGGPSPGQGGEERKGKEEDLGGSSRSAAVSSPAPAPPPPQASAQSSSAGVAVELSRRSGGQV